MQLYAIRNNGVKFQELDLEILDVTRHLPKNVDLDDVLDFSQSNTAMSGWWKTPETKFVNPGGVKSAQIPDISSWIDSTLVLSPKAYRMLGEMLKPSGEFLPVNIGGNIYYIFNCLIFGEDDKDKSRFERHDGMDFGLEHLVFKESVLDLLIFKSSIQSCLTLFCGERFKSAVESFELAGVVFDRDLIQTF